MMIEKRIRNTILEHGMINKGDHILVGLSGGPDSVCLFHVLKKFSGEMGFTISAVHVNHKFRPGAAEEDQAYVEELCRKLEVPCLSLERDCKALAEEMGISSEEAGRMVRYQVFFHRGLELEKTYGKGRVKVAVAHNLNDQGETILMRIIRGTGVDGIAGMDYIREGEGGISVIRPLLDVSRDQIEDYVNANNLNARIDYTNSQPIYTRNKLRLKLIPEISKEFNPSFLEGLIRLGNSAAQDREYFRGLTMDILKKAERKENVRGEASLTFKKEVLSGLHPAIRNRVIKKAFEAIGLDQGITAAHLEGAGRIIESRENSALTDFPRGYAMAVSYGEVRFFRERGKKPCCKQEPDGAGRIKVRVYQQGDPGLAALLNLRENHRACLDLEKVTGRLNRTTQIDDEELETMLKPRYRRQGDWMVPLGMKGRKKLQDIFVNQKVYREMRDRVPLVCIGDEVLWIIGETPGGEKTGMEKSRISENFKVDHNTKAVVFLEYFDEI